MKNLLCLFVIACGLTACSAQQGSTTSGTNDGAGKRIKPSLNHIAVYVVNLQVATTFYQDIIGLDSIPEPFHDGRHTWFAIGATSHLHLISGAAAATKHDKNGHLCFSVTSVDEFVTRLKAAHVAFENWGGEAGAITTRVDGVKQIYFQDPDGYWLEINDARD